MLTVNLIGAGKVGQTLIRVISASGRYRVQDVASTSRESAASAVSVIGAGRPVGDPSEMAPADIWFITVPDTAIAQVSSQLASVFPTSDVDGSLAVHCSGFLPSTAMAPLGERNWHLASLHPILSFADPQKASSLFSGTYCGLEGSEAALEILRPLVTAIGGRAFDIRSEDKAIYHAAAVFANNFTVVLQDVARAAWQRSGVPEAALGEISAGLLRATVENLNAFGPSGSITGPAARGDVAVVEQQQREVEAWFPEAGLLYTQLSVLARRLKAQGSVIG